jgi:hypothetical protein
MPITNQDPPSSLDCITNYTANADLSLQDHEWNKLNRTNNGRTTLLISGDDVIGNLLHNQMILTPVAIDAHGRIDLMVRQNLYGTPPPAIPPRKQLKPNRPNAKAMYDRATSLSAPMARGSTPRFPPRDFFMRDVHRKSFARSKVQISNGIQQDRGCRITNHLSHGCRGRPRPVHELHPL